jgi:2-phosphosulfolactate phosphatase
MPDRPPLFVHMLPSLIPPGALDGGTAVVMDVLRASTVIVHALASGIVEIIPCTEADEALRTFAVLPTGTALTSGERRGVTIPGFDLGNSPGDYTPEVCRGKTLVMTTTNGTRAIQASLGAARVLIGSFSNLKATAHAAHDGRPIHLVCSGTDGLISFEDTLLGGALISLLDSYGVVLANDQAEIARRAWLEIEIGGGVHDRLGEVLAHGRGGRRVIELGYRADIADAARIDKYDLVAELLRDPIRIVSNR